jgi:hypothetical protein
VRPCLNGASDLSWIAGHGRPRWRGVQDVPPIRRIARHNASHDADGNGISKFKGWWVRPWTLLGSMRARTRGATRSLTAEPEGHMR